MTEFTTAPDLSTLEIPIDSWTQPFWDAAADAKLLLPRCADCQRFRWPPGPFCPQCQSQQTQWVAPGTARVFSFTVLRPSKPDQQASLHVPALIEFSEAKGVRLLAAIVGTPLSAIHIGAELALAWSPAANAQVPVFTIT
jgi:uncharacterized OB-fold protein